MSKIQDKLQRLHTSRVRALQAGEEGQAGVFHAEPADPAPQAVSRSAAPEAAAPQPTDRDVATRQAVREQLERAERLGGRRSRPARLQVVRESRPPASAAAAPATPPSENAVGERLGELRRQAEALIAAGGLETALPLLHELAALSPTHPFALSQLAEYWRRRGNARLADHYAQRLAAVAPY